LVERKVTDLRRLVIDVRRRIAAQGPGRVHKPSPQTPPGRPYPVDYSRVALSSRFRERLAKRKSYLPPKISFNRSGAPSTRTSFG
jgi:hypothetical protein